MHGVSGARHGFDPRDIDGCRCWLRADMGVTVSSGRVTRWDSQVSGVTGHANTTGAINGPNYVSGQGGQPSLQFTGTEALLWNLEFTGVCTVVMLVKPTSAPGTGYSLLTTKDSAANQLSEMLIDLNTYLYTSFIHNLGGGAGAKNAVGHNDSLGTTAHLLLHTYNGGASDATGSYTGQLDGATKTMAASGAFGRTATDSASIGGRLSNVPAVSFGSAAEISEIIIYNRAIAAPYQTDIFGYCRSRYGI